MTIFRKILYFLSPSEKKQGLLLFLTALIVAFIDMMGVASIMPFMTVLTNPQIIETNSIINTMFEFSSMIGVKTNQEFIFLLGFLVFIILITSIGCKALLVYLQAKFVNMREYSISKNLLTTYLNQSYGWFLNQNSAGLGKSILSEVEFIVHQSLTPLVALVTQIIVSFFLIVLLLFIDIKVTFIATLSIAVVYVLIFSLSRKFVSKIGKERLISNETRFKLINEAFGASKVIKLGGLEKNFVNRFSYAASIYARHITTANVLNQMPRYFVEAITFGGMLILILFIVAKEGTFNDAIPTIAIYTFAGYRLVPSLQQIYRASTILKFSKASLDKIYEDLKNLEISNSNQDQGIIQFNKSITLNHIYFSYPNSLKTTLKDVSLNIGARSTVGLVGTTGSGKTTTIDIILGLLEPQKGTLEIDGKIITKNNISAWQNSIGYVPQHIYLSDDTIAANIAFGVELKKINYKSVEKASKISNLHEFVVNELPEQYQTIIGERGIRLSGGQRQRIGIARALYHNPKVLILDEATSALDTLTEQLVMKAINNIKKDITIITVAHRLETVKECDIIFQFEKGKLLNKGTFKELFIDSKI